MTRKIIVSVLFTVMVSFSVVLTAQEKDEAPFSTNILGTLSNPRIVKEIGLVEEQEEVIRDLLSDFGKFREELGRELRKDAENMPKEDHGILWKEFQERSEEKRLVIVSEIRETLLPEQIKRVEQLSAQRMMSEGKNRETAGLLSAQMIDYLDIDKEQQNRIRERSEEIKERVTKQIQRILEEAKNELVEELSDEQKERYEELVGKPLGQEEDEDEKRDRRRRSRD